MGICGGSAPLYCASGGLWIPDDALLYSRFHLVNLCTLSTEGRICRCRPNPPGLRLTPVILYAFTRWNTSRIGRRLRSPSSNMRRRPPRAIISRMPENPPDFWGGPIRTFPQNDLIVWTFPRLCGAIWLYWVDSPLSPLIFSPTLQAMGRFRFSFYGVAWSKTPVARAVLSIFARAK